MYLGEGLVADGVYLCCDIIKSRELVNTLALLSLQKRYAPRNHRVDLGLDLLKLLVQPLELTVNNAVHFDLEDTHVLTDLGDDLDELLL